MNPRKFLQWLGIGLVSLAGLGYLVFGPTSIQSIIGAWGWFDVSQNIIHLALGIIAVLIARLVKSDQIQKGAVAIFGFLSLAVAIVGFLYTRDAAPNLGFTNIESPVEVALYAVIAIASLWIAFMPEGPMFVKETPSAEPPSA